MNGSNVSPQLEAAFDRILNIDWINGHVYRQSHVKLTAEFLRRLYLWEQAIKCPAPAGSWPTLDIARCLYPDLELPVNLTATLRKIDHELSMVEAGFCYCFLRWNLVKNLDAVKAFGLPDPFEPLVLSFERGNRFSDERGWGSPHALFLRVSSERDSPGRGGQVTNFSLSAEAALYHGVAPFVSDEEMNAEALDQMDRESPEG